MADAYEKNVLRLHEHSTFCLWLSVVSELRRFACWHYSALTSHQHVVCLLELCSLWFCRQTL